MGFTLWVEASVRGKWRGRSGYEGRYSNCIREFRDQCKLEKGDAVQ